MESKAKFLGHPIHPILIVFPLGLLMTSIIFDGLYYFSISHISAEVGFWMAVSGIIGGLVSAVFGLIDWIAIPAKTRARRIGLIHGIANVVAVGLFIISVYFRLNRSEHAPDSWSMILALLGTVVAIFGGWLGGELVHRLNVGNDPGANVNAPSSLSNKSATNNEI